MQAAIANLAFYQFTHLSEPLAFRDALRSFVKQNCPTMRGTVLVSHEGINVFVAAPDDEAETFLAYLDKEPAFRDLLVKRSRSEAIPYSRMLIKLKKEIIPLGLPEVEPHRLTGDRLKPEELAQWIDEKKDFILLDTRNQYEVDVGTFKGAKSLRIRHFRHFPKELDQYGSVGDAREKPVVMFCTGGIRCEKATAYALQSGWKNVYQLDGGILNYFDRMGSKHYNGECFVFDQRVAVDGNLKEATTLQCFACRAPLTIEEQKDSKYIAGVSCPKCESFKAGDKRTV